MPFPQKLILISPHSRGVNNMEPVSIFKTIKLIVRDLDSNKVMMAAGFMMTAHMDCSLDNLKNLCREQLENSFSRHADIQPYIADNEMKELITYVVLLHVFYKAAIWKTIGRAIL